MLSNKNKSQNEEIKTQKLKYEAVLIQIKQYTFSFLK